MPATPRRSCAWQAGRPKGVLGINIGANRNSADPIADYVAGVHALGPLASYLAVNISSPNTPGLRDLQAPERLDALLTAVMEARASLPRPVPVLVKLAPDLDEKDIAPAMACILAHKVDGAILTNTTLSRDGVSASPHRGEGGGLSGRPLFARSTRFLAKCYLATEGKLPLIGVGGIDSAEAALAKIRAGASLVQLYTGLDLHGPQPSVRYQIRPARGDRKERLFARQPRRNRGGALGQGLNKPARIVSRNLITQYVRGSACVRLWYFRCAIPAQERVKESELRASGKLRSVIPAEAGIHLSSWNKLLYGSPPSRGRRCGLDFNRFGDFFTRSQAGIHFRHRNERLESVPASVGTTPRRLPGCR